MSLLNPDSRVFVPIDTTKECTICTDTIVDDDETKIIFLKCSHQYHKKCLQPWLDVANTCPTCRAKAVIIDKAAERAAAKAEEEAERAMKEAEEEAERAMKEAEEQALRLEAEERNKLEQYMQQNSEKEMAIILKPLENPNTDILAYPFSYIEESNDADDDYDHFDNEYRVKDFCKGLPSEEPFNVGNFPGNITEYYWIHEGKNDEEAWQLFCKIKLPELVNGYDEAYAYYSASCDYTGFDCQGGMGLTVSLSAKNLFYDLPERTRELFIAEKLVGKHLKRKRYVPAKPKYPVPTPPAPEISGKNAVNPTRAFIRVWNDGVELILSLDNVNGVEMEELDYAIRGLTAQRLQTGVGEVPKRKFYNVSIYSSACVSDIDEHFKKRFNNPEKKWMLKMRNKESSYIRKWGKVEVSFTLF